MEHTKVTPLFFFISLGVLVTLIVSVTALLNLSFETLNHALPDILMDSYQYGYATYSYDGVRSALALLIIVFPVFMVLEYFWSKQSCDVELSIWNATIRRWVLYIILFLASVTVITDLVILVRYFVSGEITMRFIVKVTLTLIISGMTGWYYIRQLKNAQKNIWFSIGAAVFVLGAIVYSFTVIGSPSSQRNLRIDQRRIEDLQSIQWQIVSYWQQKEKLPDSLQDLSNPIAGSVVPRDPEFQSGTLYEYRKIADKTFELCATFALPIPQGWVPNSTGIYPTTAMRDTSVSSIPYQGSINDNWDHQAGRTCYERTIDAELYPPFPKQK